MGGSRFNARGVDDEGNAANHTELEQIIYHHQTHNPPIAYNTQPGKETFIKKTTTLYSFL
jgi:hypothetical protein